LFLELRAAAVVGAVCLGAAALVTGGAGCGGGSAPATPDAGPEPSPQIPPMGQKAIESWLASGVYQAWTCESQISNPRAGPADPDILGPHGRHRVCSNDALLGSDSGPYPMGAASVKELFDANDVPYGYGVGLKVAPGLGVDTWYWYERSGRLATLHPLADGIGARACGTDCHAEATRDNVFIRAMK
jgi:hypothetical protein